MEGLMDDYESARMTAEQYIDYQPRTSAEVRRRLGRAGFEKDVVERVVGELETAGLLDDAKFSEEWVESRARRKGYGARRLASELRAKGISKEASESALDQLDAESELQNALTLARKRLESYPHLPTLTPEDKRRLAAFLQRRGYRWEIIQQVFAEVFQNSD
jgi:regulatory protein